MSCNLTNLYHLNKQDENSIYFNILIYYNKLPEVYLEPIRTSTVKCFGENN